MSNPADLTDSFVEVIENYSNDFGVADLDAWATEDLMLCIDIMEQVLQLRGEEYALH